MFGWTLVACPGKCHPWMRRSIIQQSLISLTLSKLTRPSAQIYKPPPGHCITQTFPLLITNASLRAVKSIPLFKSIRETSQPCQSPPIGYQRTLGTLALLLVTSSINIIASIPLLVWNQLDSDVKWNHLRGGLSYKDSDLFGYNRCST